MQLLLNKIKSAHELEVPRELHELIMRKILIESKKKSKFRYTLELLGKIIMPWRLFTRPESI